MCARIVVLVSGQGSNLQAVLDACGAGRLDAVVVAVLSDRPKAFGLQRARDAGVPAEALPSGPFRPQRSAPRIEYDEALAARIAMYRPDLIVLAGFMRILSADFVGRFRGRLINLHPALPGAWPGTHAIERALAACRSGGPRTTGVMVHHVITEVDAGPPIAVAEVEILATDDIGSLSARMHAHEHRLLVDAIATLLPQLTRVPHPRTQHPLWSPHDTPRPALGL